MTLVQTNSVIGHSSGVIAIGLPFVTPSQVQSNCGTVCRYDSAESENPCQRVMHFKHKVLAYTLVQTPTRVCGAMRRRQNLPTIPLR
eukprot:m.33853 g.33853  ORF g.33853 m.33853 type:complete len:87 (-) comp5073_c0_seq1:695-955(-)